MKKALFVIILILIISIISIIVFFFLNNEELSIKEFKITDYQNYLKTQWFSSDIVIDNANDEKALLKEVEKIFINTYGERIKKEKPFKLFYDENSNSWLVCGTISPNQDGGTACIIVDKQTGKVLALWHEK